MKGIKPVAFSDRLGELDVLRGIALFGILIVNMNLFHSPAVYADLLKLQLWTNPLDRIVDQTVMMLAQGKFYTLFSFLFGYGFYLFMTRAEKKTGKPHSLFLRRVFILLLIGLLHMFFIWWGDILTWYALTGMLLLAFYESRPRTLLIWSFSLLALIAVFTAMLVSMPNDASAGDGWVLSYYEEMLQASLQAYGEGSYSAALQQRLADLSFLAANNVITSLFLVLPMFLFGVYAAKKSWFTRQKQARRRPRFKRIWFYSLAIGLPFMVIKMWSAGQMKAGTATVYDLWNILGMTVGDISLCFFYLSSVVLLYEKYPSFFGWKGFASAGRMALTLYLMQSILCTWLFYGHGLGLYGKIGPAAGLGIAVLIYGLQLVVSSLWFKRYPYGPMEYIWRRMTYGRLRA